MLLTLAAILFVLWLVGFSMKVAGGLIHLLLVVALVVAVLHFFTGRRTTV